MGVPMRPRARHEDICAHGHVSTRQRHLAPYFAREGLRALHCIDVFALPIGYDDGPRHVVLDAEYFSSFANHKRKSI